MNRVNPILVVEDDPLAFEALTDLLEAARYRVIATSDGLDALERVYAGDPAPLVILLDLGLPIIDGWEFLRRQKNNAKIAHIPVIVITAASSPRVPAADAVLKKPIDVDQLINILARY
jgi:chemosensory pili system protein ChpA (sensor histidine kinase/response regulator)